MADYAYELGYEAEQYGGWDHPDPYFDHLNDEYLDDLEDGPFPPVMRESARSSTTRIRKLSRSYADSPPERDRK